jgi:hypothetical protein
MAQKTGKKQPVQKKEKPEPGEQMELIDVGPKSKKAILAVAKKYKSTMRHRMETLDEEIALKQQLHDLIAKEKLNRLEDGSIKLEIQGVKITVKPRDELITVKFPKDEDPDD